MQHSTREITRVYRLDFDNGEAHWDDPIPPEITSNVLGTKATCIISRTSLLAWSLMNIPGVEVADLSCEGWIQIAVATGADFDEVAFRNEVETIISDVRLVRGDRAREQPRMVSPQRGRSVLRSLPAAQRL